ncbi:MAG TPA: type VI secretion system protein TssA, partial [Stellaceae bacterium]|nr:type VI secretion system protein TssA [Stellaceae bacterium]
MQEVPEGFDLAALLAPIAAEALAGTDPRQDYAPDSLYYRLRDARADARAAERASDAEELGGGPPPQWQTIRELAVEALSHRAKDLEIAAWLTEALLRSDGLVGLAAGARLMAGLVDQFWDDFFPQPDEDGVAGRLAQVAGLNGVGGEGTLIQPLRRVVLFPRPDGTPVEFWQYEQAREVAGIGDAARRQARLDAGVLAFDTVETEARAAGGERFATLRRQAAAAAAAWRALGQTLDRHAGVDAPPTGQVQELLQQIHDVAVRFAPPEAAEEAAVPAPATAAVVAAAGIAPSAAGLASREEALRRLAEIAEFFRRTEPNSPLAYTLS